MKRDDSWVIVLLVMLMLALTWLLWGCDEVAGMLREWLLVTVRSFTVTKRKRENEREKGKERMKEFATS